MARNDQVVRLLRLARILADSRRGLPLKTLAERHEWPLRTLYRDLGALEAAGFPIIHEENRFRLPRDAYHVAENGLQPDERLALFACIQMAGGVRETAAGRALDRLWRRLSGTDPKRPLLLATDPGATLSIRSPLGVDYAPHRKTIGLIEEAIAERRALSCRYEAASTGELTARVVEPGELHWDPTLESLYLIGWCRLRGAVRIFAVQRFRMVSITATKFVPRPECRTQAALRHAFKIWRGDNLQRVAVRLTGWAARELRERKLHPSQKVERLAGGAVRVTFEVGGVEEVLRWVLARGAMALVEAPLELAARVAHEAGVASASHRIPPGKRLSNEL